MNVRLPLLPVLLTAALAVPACGGSTPREQAPAVDGRLEDGLRVLTFDPARPDARYTVYRGDYVRPELAGGAPFTLEIAALDVRLGVPAAAGGPTYFKVPDAGVFPFRLGDLEGEIEALEYRAAAYREVSAQEAAALLPNLRPFVLDVRTEREFAAGHLEDATLIPVQSLARRLDELAAHRDEPVLVYCATGNRSTVAGKMLVDAGFTKVIAMRRGTAEWAREGLPVVR
ncbi:MAG: rhodanese-like domain-containing protein [Candidatus Krumholzibacteriia bacterium]